MTERMAFSIQEAAEALGVSVTLIKAGLAQKRLRYTKFGSRILIPRWSLEELLRSTEEDEAEVPPVGEAMKGAGPNSPYLSTSGR